MVQTGAKSFVLSRHRYCAREFTRQFMHRPLTLSNKMNIDRAGGTISTIEMFSWYFLISVGREFMNSIVIGPEDYTGRSYLRNKQCLDCKLYLPFSLPKLHHHERGWSVFSLTNISSSFHIYVLTQTYSIQSTWYS